VKCLLFFSLFYSSLSLAKIHIEPYFGYSFTAIGKENLSNKNETENLIEEIDQKLELLGSTGYYHGITPGMRLGYRALNLGLGLDFTFGYWRSFKKQEIFPVLPGLFISYKLPILFRVYGSVIPRATTILRTDQDSNKTYNRSQGIKLGFSYLSLPFLSINFEWMPLQIRNKEGSSYWSHTGSVYANITF